MITVSDKAAARLKAIRNDVAVDGQVLRLVVQQSNGRFAIGVLPDVERDGDQIVEDAGEKVLLVDGFTSTMLNGAKIDLVDTPEGEQLALGPDM